MDSPLAVLQKHWGHDSFRPMQEEIIQSVAQIRQWRAEYGTDSQPFEVMATPSDAWDADGYKRLADAGVTHIMTMPWPFYHGDTDDLDKKIDAAKRYADDIISKFD